MNLKRIALLAAVAATLASCENNKELIFKRNNECVSLRSSALQLPKDKEERDVEGKRKSESWVTDGAYYSPKTDSCIFVVTRHIDTGYPRPETILGVKKMILDARKCITPEKCEPQAYCEKITETGPSTEKKNTYTSKCYDDGWGFYGSDTAAGSLEADQKFQETVEKYLKE